MQQLPSVTSNDVMRASENQQNSRRDISNNEDWSYLPKSVATLGESLFPSVVPNNHPIPSPTYPGEDCINPFLLITSKYQQTTPPSNLPISIQRERRVVRSASACLFVLEAKRQFDIRMFSRFPRKLHIPHRVGKIN